MTLCLDGERRPCLLGRFTLAGLHPVLAAPTEVDDPPFGSDAEETTMHDYQHPDQTRRVGRRRGEDWVRDAAGRTVLKKLRHWLEEGRPYYFDDPECPPLAWLAGVILLAHEEGADERVVEDASRMVDLGNVDAEVESEDFVNAFVEGVFAALVEEYGIPKRDAPASNEELMRLLRQMLGDPEKPIREFKDRARILDRMTRVALKNSRSYGWFTEFLADKFCQFSRDVEMFQRQLVACFPPTEFGTLDDPRAMVEWCVSRDPSWWFDEELAWGEEKRIDEFPGPADTDDRVDRDTWYSPEKVVEYFALDGVAACEIRNGAASREERRKHGIALDPHDEAPILGCHIIESLGTGGSTALMRSVPKYLKANLQDGFVVISACGESTRRELLATHSWRGGVVETKVPLTPSEARELVALLERLLEEAEDE